MTTSAARPVLVAGAINTDLVARVAKAPAAGETVTGSAFAIFGGGKGANQAIAAARSGAPTAMLGALGDDDFGRARRADLDAEGIDTGSVARHESEPSGAVSYTHLLPGGGPGGGAPRWPPGLESPPVSAG